MAESDVIQTGIYGLDEIFLGGVLKGNVILVEGAPGTGKTLLGTEFIYRGITEHDEPGIIVVFETAPHKLIRDAVGFGWDLEALQQQNKLKIIFTSPQVLYQELRSPDSLLLEAAAEIGAHRIFIDGISLLPVDESKRLAVLPFQSYYGLLSRAPTRFSSAVRSPDVGVTAGADALPSTPPQRRKRQRANR